MTTLPSTRHLSFFKMMSLFCFLMLVIASPALSQNILCDPDPLEISLADDVGSSVYEDVLDVTYTGGGSGAVFGYSIDISWDTDIVTAGANDFAKPDSGPFATTTWFIVQIISPGLARIDAALPGTSSGTTADDLFKATFTATDTPDYDTSALTLTLNYFRDANNADLTGFTADNGLVIVDLVSPVVTATAIVNNTLTHTNDYLKNGDAITVTATVTDGDPAFAGSNIVADLSGFGGGASATPNTYAADLATWIIPAASCTPANGTVTVTVTGTDNLVNSANDNDTIIADNTLPTVLTGLVAAPGHKKVGLSWNNASGQDTYYAGVVIRFTAWGDYADYDPAAPSYPDGPAAGDGTAFDGTGAAATHAFDPDLRDIYYYAAYVYDEARNFSIASPGAQDRATNYWLGDVGTGTAGPYDGLVNVSDITGLGSTYGLEDGDTGWKSECDVGPTDTALRLGIPLPDDQVQFEDLMIFAMNSNVVTPTKGQTTGTSEPILAWTLVEEGLWALHLVEPCANFKGLNVSASLASGSVTVSGGELLTQQASPVFLKNIDRRGLDIGLAILGRDLGFEGSGELLRIAITGDSNLDGVQVTARGIENESFKIKPALDSAVVPVRPFGLDQNSPNPFNPSTKIVFYLPEDQPVRLSIYTLDGRRVRMLMQEARGAGVNEVIWNGRDDSGRSVASGTYMYRLEAGPYSQTRKMSLMK